MGASIQHASTGPAKVHASLAFRREEAQRELEDAFRVLGMPWATAEMKRAAQKIVNDHARNTDPNPSGQRVDVRKTFPPEQIKRVESARDIASEMLAGFDVLADIEYESVQARAESQPGEVIARVSYTTKPGAADECHVAVKFRRPKTAHQMRALLRAIDGATAAYQQTLSVDALREAAEADESTHTEDRMDDKPCEHCGTTDRPRSLDRWDNWLCDPCAAAELGDEEAHDGQ